MRWHIFCCQGVEMKLYSCPNVIPSRYSNMSTVTWARKRCASLCRRIGKEIIYLVGLYTDPNRQIIFFRPNGMSWTVAYLGFGKGAAWRARGARVYNGGLGGAPSGVQGQSPWSGGQGGEAPLKLKHFLLLNVQWKPQIRPFFWNLETQNEWMNKWLV